MHSKGWLIDSLMICWLCKTLLQKKNRMGLIEKFENGGHNRSCATEHLYYIPCKEIWAKLQYNKSFLSSTGFNFILMLLTINLGKWSGSKYFLPLEKFSLRLSARLIFKFSDQWCNFHGWFPWKFPCVHKQILPCHR